MSLLVLKILVYLILNNSGLWNCYSSALNDDNLLPKVRITGGYLPDDFTLSKYIVSIRYRWESSQTFGTAHLCGGTILSSNKILTAAHCVSSSSRDSIKVVAGTPKRLQKARHTQICSVRHIIIHPEYGYLINDIALLSLTGHIKLDNKYAAIMPLPSKDIINGFTCTVFGWGSLYFQGPLTNNLLAVNLSVYDKVSCSLIFRQPLLRGNVICGGDINDNEKDACIGDSGGPLICNGSVTGIVSYGYGCATGLAGIYTNVFAYKKWIEENNKPLARPLIILNCISLLLIYDSR